MTQDEFSKMIMEGLEWMTIREMSCLFTTSVPTMKRWAKGVSMPVGCLSEFVSNRLLEVRDSKDNFTKTGTYGGYLNGLL